MGAAVYISVLSLRGGAGGGVVGTGGRGPCGGPFKLEVELDVEIEPLVDSPGVEGGVPKG